MKVLFQSGTFISAENLNLLSLAANDSGIVKGCKVYKDTLTNSLKISDGFVQFKDGTLVYLKNEDNISLDNLTHDNYYIYVVRYGNNFVIESNMLLPSDYEYVLLATINVNDDVEIHNADTHDHFEKIIEGFSIKDSVLSSASVTNVNNVKDYANYTIYFSATVKEKGFIAIPFTFPNFTIAKIRLKAVIDEDTELVLKINNGATTKYESKEISSSKFINNEYEFNIDSLGEIKNGDSCSLILYVKSHDALNHDIKIYSILMQT